MADQRPALGRAGEDAAVAHMRRLGFEALERNFRTRYGELDLVAFDGKTLAFCEVKTRRAGSGHPFDALTAGKRRRVRLMASQWLIDRSDRPHAPDLRFDAIGVTIDARDRLVAIEHLEGAF